jgi:hypothetical protein
MASSCSVARYLGALLVLLSWTAGVRADPIVTGSATLQADGRYLYQYTLTNPASAGLPLQMFGLYAVYPQSFALAFDLQNVSQPSGWTLDHEFAPILGWSTTTPGVGAGQTAVFSFTTRQPPMPVAYAAITEPYYHGVPSDSSYGDSFRGQVPGPGIPLPTSVVPEPASALLLATAGGLLLLRRWRRR